MAEAGWYRDPASGDGLRWWNGTAWGDERYPVASPPPAAFPPPGGRPSVPPVPSSGWSAWRIVALVLLGVAVLAGLAYAVRQPRSPSLTPLTKVCDALAQVDLDYGNIESTGTVPAGFQVDLDVLGGQAIDYGDPFASEVASAVAASDRGDYDSAISDTEQMNQSCLELGYKPPAGPLTLPSPTSG